MSAVLKAMRAVDEKTAALRNAKPGEKEKAQVELSLARADLALAQAGPVTATVNPFAKATYKKKTTTVEEEEDDGEPEPDDDDDDDDDDEEEEEEESGKMPDDKAEADDEEEEEEEEKKAAKAAVSSAKRALAKATTAKARRIATARLATARAGAKAMAARPSALLAMCQRLTGKTDEREIIGALTGALSTAKAAPKTAKRLERLEKTQRAARVETLIRAGYAARKVTPGNEAAVRAIAAEFGTKALRAHLEAAPAAIGEESEMPDPRGPTTADAISSDQRKIWAAQGLNEDEMLKAASALAMRQQMIARMNGAAKGN
jgi:hypothetical protein